MNMKIVVAGIAIVSGAAGSIAGYFFATKQLQNKYNAMLEEEIDKTKAYYKRLYKKDEYETPEEAVKALVPTQAAAALLKYQGRHEEVSIDAVDEGAKEFAEQTLKNIFETDTTTEIPEEEQRRRTEEAPYILGIDEFMKSDTHYTQSTITYYAGDKTLADSREDIIREIDDTVGEANLERFGHGSGDPNVVYIRNDRLAIEFEVLLSTGKYSKEVAGLEE